MKHLGRGAAAMLLSLAAPDCGAPPASLSDGGTATGALLASAEWRLAWDRAGVTTIDPAQGGGFTVTTDLGYRVHLRVGHVVDHSLAFGRCEEPAGDAGALLGLPFVRSAWAHEAADPSSLELGLDEDFAAPTDAGPFVIAFPQARYCRVHWLAGLATVAGGASEDQRLRTSLRIEGSWEREGQRGDFALRTWWPEGKLLDLEEVTDPASLGLAAEGGSPLRARVLVTRKLAPIFDAIDFATASDDQILGRTLQNLVAGARMSVTLAAAE